MATQPVPPFPDPPPEPSVTARAFRSGLILLAVAGGLFGTGVIVLWPHPSGSWASLGFLLVISGLSLLPLALLLLLGALLRARRFCQWLRNDGWALPLVGFLVLAMCASDFLCTSPHPRDGDRLVLTCQNNLRQIGGLLLTERDAGRLRILEGAAFLTQLAPLVSDDDLKVFLCPGDPGAPEANARDRIHCSYRGPDLETARRFVEGTLPKDAILACDACGDDGTGQWHDRGLCVLYPSLKVECMRRGAPDGAPAKVGPGSEAPRFVRLVR